MRYLLLAGCVLLTACGTKLHIESDTSWSGAVGGVSGTTVDGTGNEVLDIDNGDCWSFQKQTRQGSLRVYAESGTIFGPAKYGDESTTAEFGVVSGCEGEN